MTEPEPARPRLGDLAAMVAKIKTDLPALTFRSADAFTSGGHPGLGPSPSWVREQLARFTYKPGWTFKVITPNAHLGPADRSMIGGPFVAYLAVHFRADDTYNPGREIEIGGTFSLDYLPEDEERFARKLADIVKDMEVHESREWLRRDGEIFDNPHDPRPFR